jgi:hypothetical protein
MLETHKEHISLLNMEYLYGEVLQYGGTAVLQWYLLKLIYFNNYKFSNFQFFQYVVTVRSNKKYH